MTATPGFEFVGAGLDDSFAGAARILSRLPESSDPSELLRSLDEYAAEISMALADHLDGYDSFDTLGFLRMALDMFNRDRPPSDVPLERVQAAQDVVALSLLGKGLPRTALTGTVGRQPDFDRVLEAAAELLRIAQLRAYLESQLEPRALGALAAQFKGYEIRVRGRQFESIASSINDALLDNSSVRHILENTLGFSLDDVRRVRESAINLLEERFFGARDRIASLVLDHVEPDPRDVEAFEQDMSLMVSECRRFASLAPFDLVDETGLPVETIEAVLTTFSTARPKHGDPAPLDELLAGRPPRPWGCIRDESSFLILNGFLSESELRRDIERVLNARLEDSRPWANYIRKRASASESQVAETVTRIIGEPPHWEGQKYWAPDEGVEYDAFNRDADIAPLNAKLCESDLLFLVDGVAFCIEVKAGSITEKSRSGNAARLATDLEKTLSHGNEQADRLIQLITRNGGVWTQQQGWIDLTEVKEIHSVIVMLDDMGPLSLSMNELANHGVIAPDSIPWIVSMHDLTVLSETLTHPAHFLEYVRRRRGRRLATMVTGVDELDLFMWFLNGGMYFAPAPDEAAAQIPLALPLNPADLRRYEEQLPVHVGTLTDPLDNWFYWKAGLTKIRAPRPTREEAPWVMDYLRASAAHRSPGWLRVGADLAGLSGEAQAKFGEALSQQLKASRSDSEEHSVTTHGTGPHGSWLLVAAVVPKHVETDPLAHYLADKQYQTQSSRATLLLYRAKSGLFASHFRGGPIERTAVREIEVLRAGLLSLEETFLYSRRRTATPKSSPARIEKPRGNSVAKNRRKQARKSRRANRRS